MPTNILGAGRWRTKSLLSTYYNIRKLAALLFVPCTYDRFKPNFKLCLFYCFSDNPHDNYSLAAYKVVNKL